MKFITHTALVIALMGIFSACSMLAGSSGADLAGTSWTLTQINGSAPIIGRQLTLQFNDTSATGNSGCNSFGGQYTTDGNKITFTNLASTLMACADADGNPDNALMDQEQAYLNALNKATVYTIKDDTLNIGTDENPAVLVFTRGVATTEPTSQPTEEVIIPGTEELAGTSWNLTEINGQAPIADRPVTIQFDDKQANGTSGCNSYGGEYTIDGNKITFSNVFMTEMACMDPQGIMEQEMAFHEALRTATVYSIEGDTLKIGNDQNPAVLVFTRGQTVIGPSEPITDPNMPVSSDDLVGSSWKLTEINGKPPVPGVDVTLTFEADGKAGGSGGCNGYGGSYSAANGTISFKEIVSTMMACAEQNKMDQEQVYFDALNKATIYSVEGDTLKIGTDADPAVLVFTRTASE